MRLSAIATAQKIFPAVKMDLITFAKVRILDWILSLNALKKIPGNVLFPYPSENLIYANVRSDCTYQKIIEFNFLLNI